MTKTRILAAGLVLFLPALALAQSALVDGDPGTLIVQAEDLPAEFPMVGGQPQGDGYVALFFRPQVLMEETSKGDILGVMASLEVLGGADAAASRFKEKQDAESIGSSVGGPAPGAEQKVLKSEKLEAEVLGVDEAILFRVEYELQGVHVIDYRYRLRLLNAVANLIISARAAANGGEPEAFAGQARGIASRQAARLAGGG